MQKEFKAIDTNVLVRIIVKDDTIQNEKALNYIKKNQPVFISHLVLFEFSWVLMRSYGIKKAEFLKVMDSILKTEEFLIENSDVVWLAMHEYKQNNLDFPDCLIGSIAKHNESSIVATFDKKATRSRFFEIID